MKHFESLVESVGLVISMTALAAPAFAEPVRFDLPAQPVGSAVLEFGHQSKLDIVVTAEAAQGQTSTAVSGMFEARDALAAMLKSTDLSVVADNGKIISLARRSAAGVVRTALITAQSDNVEPSSVASSGAPQELALEEVVVTANKREENLQKVSVAVTAISAENLQALGVTSAADLTQVVPNLNANTNGNGATVAIRGIVSTNQTVTGDPAVSYSLDGVTLVRMQNAVSGMYDVARVEVLRGPQGTLYGANATAGSIGVITNKPDLSHTSLSGSIGFGNYDAFSASGMFNAPITDTLGFRAAVNTERHAGYVDLVNNNRKWSDQDFTAGRVHLLWSPTDNFSALLTYDTSHNGGAGSSGNSSGAPLGLYAVSTGTTPYQRQSMPGPIYLDETTRSTTLTLNWSLPFVDLTYVGNTRTDDWLQSNAQAIYGPLSSYCKNTSSLNCFNPLINSSDDRQISHELRFSKKYDALNWVLGFYYLKDDVHYTQAYEPSQTGGGTLWQLIDAPDYFQGSKAAFGQATWSIVDRLRLIGGLRRTKDEKRLYAPNYMGPIGSIVNQQCFGCTVTAIYSGNDSWAQTTWRAGAEFDVNPDSLLFASVATGYKAGGFGAKGIAPNNYPYGPEHLTNYELGWKNQLFNSRLQVNADAFFMKYSDYQASSSIIQANGQQTLLTVNAGKAEIKGIEIESTMLLTPYDRLSLNATYLNAKFTSFFLPNGDGYAAVAGPVPTDYTGKELPYAPHNTVRLGYEHTFDLPNAGSLTARIDSGYTSHQWLDYHDYDAISQDAYTRTGLSLTWERSKSFSTQVYVRNIENKAVLAGAQADQAAPNRDFNDFGKEGYYMPPRTFGIKFTAGL